MTLASHQDNYNMNKTDCKKYHLEPNKIQPVVLKNGKIVERCIYCERFKDYALEERKKERENDKRNLTDKYIVSVLMRNTKLRPTDITQDLIKTQRLILSLKNTASLFECKKHGSLQRSDFIKSGKDSNGQQRFKCKVCMSDLHKKHYENNKEKILAEHALYRKEHHAKYIASKRASAKKNRILFRERNRARQRAEEIRNPLSKKRRQKKYKDMQTRNLSDQYIKQQLVRDTHLKHADIPDSLVAMKKTLMMIKRQAKVLIIEEKKHDDEDYELGTIEK